MSGVIRDATPADLPLIREIFASANDLPYDLVRVAEEKCFGDGFAGPPQVRLFDDAGVAVRCGGALRILAVHRAHRRRGIGSALLADSDAKIIGAEAGNYFVPGVPPAMVNWLTKRGYRERSRTRNMTTEQLGDAIPPGVVRGDHRALDFIELHFGAVLRFESQRALRIFVIEEEGRIAGFSAHGANNRGLGTFGPLGVASEFRRRGFGRALLLASLADLRRLGYARAIIPWTGAIDFYERACGARVEQEFVIMEDRRPRPS
jgi:GNAT superfamily N-acetyltransferase